MDWIPWTNNQSISIPGYDGITVTNQVSGTLATANFSSTNVTSSVNNVFVFPDGRQGNEYKGVIPWTVTFSSPIRLNKFFVAVTSYQTGAGSLSLLPNVDVNAASVSDFDLMDQLWKWSQLPFTLTSPQSDNLAWSGRTQGQGVGSTSDKTMTGFIITANLNAQDAIGMRIGYSAESYTDPCSGKQVFRYTGSDQNFTVPEGTSEITIKAWGAGGATSGAAGNEAFAGGFTQATISVNSGDVLGIMVGEGGSSENISDLIPCSTGNRTTTYGFGGISRHIQRNAGGDTRAMSAGGLSGAFVGGAPILETDNNRALAIAGGSSTSGNDPYGNVSFWTDAPGNDIGGNATMQGHVALATDCLIDRYGPSGGGGGYTGGARVSAGHARGGQGFALPSAISTTILTATGQEAPNNLDPDYLAGIGEGGSQSKGNLNGGHGLVVITWTPDYCNTCGPPPSGVCCNDGTISLKKIRTPDCPDDFTIDFKLYNGDDAPMPIGTPITFYDGDPQQPGSVRLTTFQISNVIQDGATENFKEISLGTCLIQNKSQQIFTVLADDGTHALPLNLSTQISDGYDDCNMENNISSIKIKTVCGNYEDMLKLGRE